MLKVQKPQLGSHKIVFKTVNISNMTYLRMDDLSIDFTGFKVKSCKTIYHHSIDFNSESYDSDVFLMVQEIKDILKNEGLVKSTYILNFMSDNMFFEEIQIPKLSSIETQKSLDLEIRKLYPNYDKKYVYQMVKSNLNKHTNSYHYAFIDRIRYEKILKWFKDARISLSYVSLVQGSVKRMLGKTNFFAKKKNSLFINMNYDYTEFYNYEGKKLDGVRACNEGLNKVVLMASKLYNISIEEAMNRLENNLLEDDEYYKEFSKEIKFLYTPVLTEIKRMIGGFDHEKGIEAIYLNIENSSNDFLVSNLEKILKVNFVPLTMIKKQVGLHLSSYGAFIKQNRNFDFIFPIRVRGKLNEQKR